MSLNTNNLPKTGNKPKQVAAPGTYPARVVQLLDMGLQPQRPFKGEDKPAAHEIMVTYELVDEFLKDDDGEDILDKPRWVSERFPVYPLTVELAKATKRYLAIDPEQVYEGNWASLIGMPINVTLVINKNGDKVYENIGALTPMRAKDAEKVPPLVNPTKVFDMDNPDMEVFNKIPEWIQGLMTTNLEFKGSKLQELIGDVSEDQVEEVALDEEEPF